MFEILATVENWLKDNRRVALATVVETWGSSPRQAGAKMGVAEDMAMIGSVSGGCVETAVVGEALDSLTDGKPRLLHFGVSDDEAWDVGLACGGQVSVYVEPLDETWWRIASGHIRHDQALMSFTVIDGDLRGEKLLAGEDGLLYATPALEPHLRDALVYQAGKRLKPGRTKINDVDVLVEIFRPRPRLVIIGGAHVAMALKNYAHILGFRVSLIDPRQAFATQERFPDVESISHHYPDKALPEIGLNSETYIAVLTHDPKIDDPALRVGLPAHVPYIGILSSKRSHEKRVQRLTEAGMNHDLLEQVRTPIGLEIGARTPEEIALAIMAEIVAVKNGALE
jgi:xanthine dehydrogenase accessory factor